MVDISLTDGHVMMSDVEVMIIKQAVCEALTCSPSKPVILDWIGRGLNETADLRAQDVRWPNRGQRYFSAIRSKIPVCMLSEW